MEKLRLKDNTNFAILAGARLDSITIVTDTFTSLGVVAEALTKPNNLDTVQFTSEVDKKEEVLGNYTDMLLESPLFKSVDFLGDEKKIAATIAIREKTDIEKRLDAIEAGQEVQDGALADLGDMVSTMAEGGAV